MSIYKKILSLSFLLFSLQAFSAAPNSKIECKSLNERAVLTFYENATLIKQDSEDDPPIVISSGKAINFSMDGQSLYYASFDKSLNIEETVQNIVVKDVKTGKVSLELNKIYVTKSDEPDTYELGYFIKGIDPRNGGNIKTPILTFCKTVPAR